MTQIRHVRAGTRRDDLPHRDHGLEIRVGLGRRDRELRQPGRFLRLAYPRPRLTTRLTGLPRARCLPALGFWLRTLPRACRDRARRMRPTAQCLARIIRRARLSLLPTTRGTLQRTGGGAPTATTNEPFIAVECTSHLNRYVPAVNV